MANKYGYMIEIKLNNKKWQTIIWAASIILKIVEFIDKLKPTQVKEYCDKYYI